MTFDVRLPETCKQSRSEPTTRLNYRELSYLRYAIVESACAKLHLLSSIPLFPDRCTSPDHWILGDEPRIECHHLQPEVQEWQRVAIPSSTE